MLSRSQLARAVCQCERKTCEQFVEAGQRNNLTLDLAAVVRHLHTHIVSPVVQHILIMVLVAFATTGCKQDPNTTSPLLVFAASSLQPALTEIATTYRSATHDSVLLVFGSSTDLATQIENGAPADIFFAADEATIERLSTHGKVIDSTRTVYAIGQLALITQCGKPLHDAASLCPPLTLNALSDSTIRNIAIANPAHAPYGRAAQQALERSNMWTAVQPRIVMGASVAHALQFVESGNADAGLVALSLVMTSNARHMSYTVVNPTLHDPIRHEAAVVPHSNERTARSVQFLTFVRSDSGRAVLHRYGFETTAPPAGR